MRLAHFSSKGILTTIVVCILANVMTLAQVEPIDSFRGHKWGTSEEALRRAFSEAGFDIFDLSPPLRIFDVHSQRMFGLAGNLGFILKGGVLVGGIWSHKGLLGPVSQSDFVSVVSSLSRKYGEPTAYAVNSQLKSYVSPMNAYEDFDWRARNKLELQWMDKDNHVILLSLTEHGNELTVNYRTPDLNALIEQKEDY